MISRLRLTRWTTIGGLCLSWLIASADEPESIPLADLTIPPAGIAKLIQEGSVSFEWGGREESDRTDGRGSRLLAETHYRVAYRYNSRSRWSVNRDSGQVVVFVRFNRVTWTTTHRIWFRERPDMIDPWDGALMLHEFDHVAISSDPRIANQFKQRIQAQRRLSFPLPADKHVDQRVVDELIDDFVRQTVHETSELIDIRYLELDRITKHGQLALSKDSELGMLLSEIAPAARQTSIQRESTENKD